MANKTSLHVILSRPQTKSLFSFILFLLIAYSLIVINILAIRRDPQPLWVSYLIITVLAPIALFITYKIVFRYKTIRMGNSQIEVRYPQFRSAKSYPLKEVESWTESIIKTGKTSTYKELEIRFTDGRKITMAFREYTEYDKMVGYLGQKVPKLKKLN